MMVMMLRRPYGISGIHRSSISSFTYRRCIGKVSSDVSTSLSSSSSSSSSAPAPAASIESSIDNSKPWLNLPTSSDILRVFQAGIVPKLHRYPSPSSLSSTTTTTTTLLEEHKQQENTIDLLDKKQRDLLMRRGICAPWALKAGKKDYSPSKMLSSLSCWKAPRSGSDTLSARTQDTKAHQALFNWLIWSKTRMLTYDLNVRCSGVLRDSRGPAEIIMSQTLDDILRTVLSWHDDWFEHLKPLVALQRASRDMAALVLIGAGASKHYETVARTVQQVCMQIDAVYGRGGSKLEKALKNEIKLEHCMLFLSAVGHAPRDFIMNTSVVSSITRPFLLYLDFSKCSSLNMVTVADILLILAGLNRDLPLPDGAGEFLKASPDAMTELWAMGSSSRPISPLDPFLDLASLVLYRTNGTSSQTTPRLTSLAAEVVANMPSDAMLLHSPHFIARASHQLLKVELLNGDVWNTVRMAVSKAGLSLNHAVEAGLASKCSTMELFELAQALTYIKPTSPGNLSMIEKMLLSRDLSDISKVDLIHVASRISISLRPRRLNEMHHLPLPPAYHVEVPAITFPSAFSESAVESRNTLEALAVDSTCDIDMFTGRNNNVEFKPMKLAAALLNDSDIEVHATLIESIYCSSWAYDVVKVAPWATVWNFMVSVCRDGISRHKPVCGTQSLEAIAINRKLEEMMKQETAQPALSHVSRILRIVDIRGLPMPRLLPIAAAQSILNVIKQNSSSLGVNRFYGVNGDVEDLSPSLDILSSVLAPNDLASPYQLATIIRAAAPVDRHAYLMCSTALSRWQGFLNSQFYHRKYRIPSGGPMPSVDSASRIFRALVVLDGGNLTHGKILAFDTLLFALRRANQLSDHSVSSKVKTKMNAFTNVETSCLLALVRVPYMTSFRKFDADVLPLDDLSQQKRFATQLFQLASTPFFINDLPLELIRRLRISRQLRVGEGVVDDDIQRPLSVAEVSYILWTQVFPVAKWGSQLLPSKRHLVQACVRYIDDFALVENSQLDPSMDSEACFSFIQFFASLDFLSHKWLKSATPVPKRELFEATINRMREFAIAGQSRLLDEVSNTLDQIGLLHTIHAATPAGYIMDIEVHGFGSPLFIELINSILTSEENTFVKWYHITGSGGSVAPLDIALWPKTAEERIAFVKNALEIDTEVNSISDKDSSKIFLRDDYNYLFMGKAHSESTEFCPIAMRGWDMQALRKRKNIEQQERIVRLRNNQRTKMKTRRHVEPLVPVQDTESHVSRNGNPNFEDSSSDMGLNASILRHMPVHLR